MSSANVDPVSKQLRILIILNLEWNRHLGAARIYMELADQWRAAGHEVERFTFSEAFPSGHRSSREFAVRRLLFPIRAAAFVRKHRGRFDVIDALIGSIKTGKAGLNFTGLLVARSVGSHRLYDEFEKSVHTRWPGMNQGSVAGRLFYGAVNRRVIAVSDSALRQADLINVPNTEEAEFLRRDGRLNAPVLVEPYGLTDEQYDALSSTISHSNGRLQAKRISFVGMWAPRKGSKVWGEIIRRVRQQVPEAKFRFLGTMVSAETVLSDVGDDVADSIESISEFTPDDLPNLLADCTVGAFPSYVEGFGLAVLEQLAAGIPTVAFNHGGPRDILRDFRELLVTTGNVEEFANALVRTLGLGPAEYQQLQRASIETAQRYRWPKISSDTAEYYRSALTDLGSL
ncbi:MAG: glycosyltransferase family 4 protein [Chthoniobacterales bacterium]